MPAQETSETCFIEKFDQPIQTQFASYAPLLGVSVGVKDNIDIAHFVTGAGSPTWRKNQGKAEVNAPVIDQLLAAGCRLVGKTYLDELAYSLMGANAHYGTPLNPKAPQRMPGGSSSGSASATAQSLCMLGVGSDTGGSVRLPASFCGLYGLRPSHGRMSNAGLVPLAPSFDTVGYFTRDLPLMVRVCDAMGLGEPLSNKIPQICFPEPTWDLILPQFSDSLTSLRKSLAEHGPTSTLFDCTDFDHLFETFRTIQAYEAWQALGPFIEEYEPSFGPGVRERFKMAASISYDSYIAASKTRNHWVHDLLEHWPDDVVLCVPTAPGPAPLKTTSEPELDGYRNRALRLLCPSGLAKLPQLSMPLTQVADAPVGVSLIGKPGADALVLIAAEEIVRHFQKL